MKLNPKLYLSVLIILNIVIIVLFRFFINTDELLLNNLSEQMTQNKAIEVFEFNQKWGSLVYVFLPLILLLKIAVISGVLYVGVFIFNKKVEYKKLFLIATKAEFIFVLVAIIKLIWFSFQDDYALSDVQYFYPLSALSIIGYEDISPWFIYPFQMLNIFEFAYWILLAYSIGKQLKVTTDFGLKIVASSYGSAILIWTITVMFFALNAN